MSGHSPGPWEAKAQAGTEPTDEAGWFIVSEDGTSITGWGQVTQTEANARRIVTAANAHDDLLAACKAAASKPAEAAAIMRENNLKIDNHDDPYQKLAFTFYTMLAELAGEADRAIALAEGTP